MQSICCQFLLSNQSRNSLLEGQCPWVPSIVSSTWDMVNKHWSVPGNLRPQIIMCTALWLTAASQSTIAVFSHLPFPLLRHPLYNLHILNLPRTPALRTQPWILTSAPREAVTLILSIFPICNPEQGWWWEHGHLEILLWSLRQRRKWYPEFSREVTKGCEFYVPGNYHWIEITP